MLQTDQSPDPRNSNKMVFTSFHCQLRKKRIISIRTELDQIRIRIRSISFQVDNEKSWTPLYLRIEDQCIDLFEGSMNPLDPNWESKWLYFFSVDNAWELSTGSNGVSPIWWITLNSTLNIHQNGVKPFDGFVRIQSGLFPDYKDLQVWKYLFGQLWVLQVILQLNWV